MRIAFIVIGNSRRSNYLTGDTIRYGNGGSSGTDGSSILIAEYLAKQGHDVVFAFDRLESQLEQQYKEEGKDFTSGVVVNGVTYTFTDFENIENLEFDILVSSLWFSEYETMPIKVTKSIIYWCHMQWIYGIGELLNYCEKNNLTLGFVHISEWESEMNNGVVQIAKKKYGDKVFTTLIPNPIMDEMINKVLSKDIKRKPHKFVFHAGWARGGNVAVEALRQLDFTDLEFHSFDYLLATHQHTDSFFNSHNGVDKHTLFSHIAESEYFLYPLYTPYEDVHKDTFSCVVAEAIALGAIPITYPLGALPEYFCDYCFWINFPKGSNPEKMQNEPLSKDFDGLFKNNIKNIVDAIYYLEQNPRIKQSIRTRGRDYILSNFNVDRIGNMWVDFINMLIK